MNHRVSHEAHEHMPSGKLRVSKLPASQQLVSTVTSAFDQPRTPALPLPIVCHLLGSGNQLHPTGLYQPALPLSHRTPSGKQGHVEEESAAPPEKRRRRAGCDLPMQGG